MGYSSSGSSTYNILASGLSSFASVPSSMSGVFAPNTTTDQLLVAAEIATGDATQNRNAFWAVGSSASDPAYGQSRVGGTTGAATTSVAYSGSVYNWFAAVYDSTTSRSIFLAGANKTTNTANLASISCNKVRIGNQSSGAVPLVGNGAEVAVWSAALTDDEIASLAKGFPPRRIRPQSLVFYAPLIRDLNDIKAGATLTNTGFTVTDHPRRYG